MKNIKYNQKINKKDSDTKHNFALFVPELKHNDWIEEDGKVVLYLKTMDPIKRFLAWMVNRKSITSLDLDDRCSAVWKYIDGERTIYDIAKLMAENYKDDVNGELYRLVTYLKYLSKRGWIKFKEYEA